MCAVGDCGDVIVLSDDDDDVVCSGPGVDTVRVGEEEKETYGTTFDFTLNSLCCISTMNCTYCSFSSPSAEDVVVTFSCQPEPLPHARHDCPLHPFTQVSQLVSFFTETLSSKFTACHFFSLVFCSGPLTERSKVQWLTTTCSVSSASALSATSWRRQYVTVSDSSTQNWSLESSGVG